MSHQIAICSDLIKKSKSYLPFNTNGTRVSPPDKASQHWFSFDKSYHPLIITDDKGKAINDPNIYMQFELSVEYGTAATFVEPFVTICKPVKGVYWFHSIIPHIGGTFKSNYTPIFQSKSTEKKVRDLLHTMKVKHTDEEKAILSDIYSGTASDMIDDNGKDTAKNQRISSKYTKKRQSADISDAASSNAYNFPSVTSSGSTSAKKGSRSSKVEVDTLETDEELLQLHSKTLPYPLYALPCKGRLNRSMKGTHLNGAVMQVNLPPSLVTASLDDKSCEETSVGIIHNTIESLQSSPTVNELFARVQVRCRTIIEAQSVINLFKQSFEYLFEDNVLYANEKRRFKKALSLCCTKSVCYGDVFGAKYLLRFIILVVLGSDAEQQRMEVAKIASSSRDGIHRSSSRIKDSDAHGDDNDSDSASPSKLSQMRRSAIIDRQVKTKFYQMEQVINEVIKELDESSHYLFV